MRLPRAMWNSPFIIWTACGEERGADGGTEIVVESASRRGAWKPGVLSGRAV